MQQPPNHTQPQSYAQQQFQQPTEKQPPKKNVKKRVWLLVIAGFVIAILLGFASREQNQQPAPAAQATQQPTLQPTQQPTIPTSSQINNLLITDEPDVTIASYNQQSATLVLQEAFGSIVPLSQNEAKLTLQEIQETVWQRDWYFSQVTVNIIQAQDNGPNKQRASSVITWKTASQINWTSVSDLWEKYDQKYLDLSLPNW